MQLLVFTVGAEDYAIESRRVIEVLPLVTARPIPRMPDFVKGVFTHRGRLVPLIDLGWLLADRPLRETLSTRVIVVEYSVDSSHQPIPLGVAAENVLSLCPDDGAVASSPGMRSPTAPCLGRLLRIAGRTIQVLDVDRLLPPSLIAGLASASPSSTGGRSGS